MIADEAFLQQAVQLFLVVQDERFLAVALVLEREQLALAAVLRHVHGEVGILAQACEVPGVLGIVGHAHGRAHLERAPVRRFQFARLERMTERVEQRVDGGAVGTPIDEHQELVARDACEQARPLEREGHGAACGLDVMVAPVVAVGIVDVLEVVQIQHHHGGDRRRVVLQPLRHLALERAAVQQAGEDVVIAFMLDAPARLDLVRHVLDEAEHAVLLLVLHDDETHPAGLSGVGQQVAPGSLFLRVFPERPQQAAELAVPYHRAGHAVEQRFHARIGVLEQRKRREEPVCAGDGIGFRVVFERADRAVGQFEDLREARCGVGHLRAERLNGVRQLVDLDDAG